MMRPTGNLTVTVSAKLTPGLRLEVDVVTFAARDADGQWAAVWRIDSLGDRPVRWAGDASQVAAASALHPARDWYYSARITAPAVLTIDLAAHAEAERALAEWLSSASSTEAAPYDHMRDSRDSEASALA